ncbi:thioredoxin domain-containing protein [Tamlana sp. 2201CG12-4]|uniref:thioredoxin family protein n=1 Tax=Tamlana sp. 2201CG12-4 TaxID=3112582 RepID=UPI002DB7D9E3|nr:thioredoxin domain-containing protein [Tamlana sp. 2201CG12-4]MEC3907100.1 thioredoxin domain-containing protein [Tamlana sp. 2201CG12-4]
MKKRLVIILALVTYSIIDAQGINFEQSTFAEVLTKAKAENKMVFMDAYTTWCGPCKMMSKEVFTQKEVGEYLNTNFVSVKMDMEKGEGIQLAKMYNVQAYPTLLFMDANGKVLHTKVGGLDTEDFIAEAKIANDPTRQFWYIEKQYKEGKRDLATVSAYVKALFEIYKRDEAKKIGRVYIPFMSKAQYNTEEGFTIIAYSGVDYKSEPFNYILKNETLFAENEKIGKQSVDYVIGNAVSSYVNNIASAGTLNELKTAIEETKRVFKSPQQATIESNYYNTYYLANKQYGKWFDINKKQAEETTEKNISLSMYINMAYRIAVDSTFADAGLYKKAIEMTKGVVTKDTEFLAAYYCLAELYKKVNNKEQALQNINAFIEKNAAKGGAEDQRVTNLKAAIENM